MTNMALDATPAEKGLEGIIASKTSISYIDGQNGRLFYQGIEINELADNSTFEETVYLLWHGQLPNRQQLAELDATLKAHRQIPPQLIELMGKLPNDASPMEVLRTCVSALSAWENDSDDTTPEALVKHATRLTSAAPTIVAAWERIRTGQDVVDARDDLSHAANFLNMLCGEAPNPGAAKVLDIALILHADHGLNASTFSARVTASTLADMYSAITSAIGTLKGPLHGGANEAVLKMLRRIGSLDQVPDFIEGVKSGKERLMGFGHRVYKNYDPRATIIKKACDDVFDVVGVNPLLKIAVELEKIALEDDYFVSRKLYPNVDFYSGLIYEALQFPPEMFTVLFAIPRTSGWLAQWLELVQDPEQKIARPKQIYTGPRTLDFVSANERWK